MTAKALTIAGSDSGACAGIQADLKTFAALGVFGTSAITALTAQNTCGVDAVMTVSATLVSQQINAVISDIGAQAIKTGMLANSEIIAAVCRSLQDFSHIPLVVDPVMVATSGARLIDESASHVLVQELAPRAILLTPNLPEAEVILGDTIATDLEALKQAAQQISKRCQTSVLLKGGHISNTSEACDVLATNNQCTVLTSPWIDSNNTHGTGCTLSAAIAAYLAKNYTLADAVSEAKHYISAAIRHSDKLTIGQGHGPVHHFYAHWS